MRRFELVGSLVDVWCFSLHIINDRALPPDYTVGRRFGGSTKDNLWPCDLDILAREIVLNEGNRGDRTGLAFLRQPETITAGLKRNSRP